MNPYGRNERSTRAEWKVPKWANGGMHQKRWEPLIYIPLPGRAMQCHILTEPFNLFQKNLKSPNSDHIRNIFVKTWSWWDGSYCLGSAKQILQVKVKTFICGICGIICHIHYNFGGIEQSKLQQSFVLNAKIFRIDVYLVYSTRITMRTFSSSSGKCVYKRLPSITKTYFYWRLVTWNNLFQNKSLLFMNMLFSTRLQKRKGTNQ